MKKMAVGTFSVIMALNILQINVFLIILYDAQITSGEPGSKFISDMITAVWYGEIVIGLIMSVVLVLIYRSRKKRKEESPPIETPKGWLVIYHGVRQTAAGSIYRLGLALFDLDPTKRMNTTRCM